jgi:putative Mg2+ transporter-C (MgtC) family protein
VRVTTAASIWLAAAIGIAAGTGRLSLAVVVTILGFVILTILGPLERWLIGRDK